MLAEAGAFRDHVMTELIEGEIWILSPIHSWHARTTAEIAYQITSSLRESGLDLRTFLAVSVALSDDSVPEPDVSVGTHDAGDVDKPLARTALRLAVEVSDSTLQFDLERKTRLYGRAGVPEYWIVARDGARVIQQWSPTADGYAERREVPFGRRLTSETIRDLAIDTTSLLS